jgi:hypothetical protein
MKTIVNICGALLLVVLAFATSSAQKGVIKLNILSPVVKTLNLQYEHAVGSSNSYQLGLFYTGASSGSTDIKGFGITPEFRFYLSATKAPQGTYIAPFARYQNFDLTDGPNRAKLHTFGGGLIIGKQWIFKEIIAFDVFIGPSYYSGKTTDVSGSDNFSVPSAINGFGLRAGVCFGFAF